MRVVRTAEVMLTQCYDHSSGFQARSAGPWALAGNMPVRAHASDHRLCVADLR
jgi:hypothetical protein